MYYIALDCRELAEDEYGSYVWAFCFVLFSFTPNLPPLFVLDCSTVQCAPVSYYVFLMFVCLY